MSEIDPRKKFLLSQVRPIFQLNEVPRSFFTDPVLDDFLNTTQINAVKITLDPDSKSLEISPIKQSENGNANSSSIEVCITKIRDEEINMDNIQHQIIVSTINSSPLLTLLNQLKNVYLPTLESAKWADKVDNNIKRLLDELKAGLDNSLSKGSNLNLYDFDENDFMGILSPADEFEAWQNVARSSTNPSLQSRAQHYDEEFSKIHKFYQNLKSVEIGGLKEVIDQTLEVLDSVWNHGKGNDFYKDKRMENLLDLISTAIGGRVQAELPDSEIWSSSFLDARSKLNECLKACKAWSEGLYTYTQQIWMSKTAVHRWRNEKYTSAFINNLIKRLEEILDIRAQHDELLRIYSMQKGLKINFEEIFSPFKQVNSLHVSVYALPAWENAKAQYSKNIEAVESDIAGYLRQEIFADLSNPSQAVKEMERWQGLLSRPNMMKLLQVERDQLLANLFTYVDKIQQEFQSQSGEFIDEIGTDVGVPSAHNLSPVVNKITWVRSLSAKVAKVLKSGQTLLSGLKKFENFDQQCRSLHETLRNYENEQFESWKDNIQNILRQPNQTLSLQMSGKLMELDLTDNLLKVNYSDRLVLLLKEVRQLCEMGFRKQIPGVIHKTAEDGKRFYKEALTLKQIANFYNAMDLQTIESQKPMLAELAIRFEEVVLSTPGKSQRDQNGVNQITWNDPEELEKYIARAQEAAQGIMNEIRSLRKVHLAICDKVNELFNVDLLKHRNTWKERIDKIKGTIESVALGRDPKLVKKWRMHWDYQLYKVLEYQYQKGLDNLNQNLPEIKIELVYSSKNVSYKPALEELKQKYYKEVKTFITFPSSTPQGFGGSSEIFKQMPERNSKYLSVVYFKTEELFSKLLKFMDSFKQWTSMGAINMEVIIEKYFKANDDWEFNLKNLRLKRRDLEKVPETFKIDCFTISLSPFKNTIEDLIQRHIETMTSSLRNSIKVECDQIDEFINYAYEKLTHRPSSIEEITQSKAEVYEINQKRQELYEKFKHTEEKNKLLRNMVGNAHNISNISKRWENFDVALEGFNQMLSEQQEVIKNEIERKCNSLNSDIEKFYQRWSALKPKKLDQLDRESAKETASKMKEWRAMWDDLEKKAQTLETDSVHFELQPPEFGYIAEIRGALVEQEQSWKFFDEFEEELAAMEKEDWLSFRSKVYLFQDFTYKWADKLKTLNKDACCLYLMSQVDLYKSIWPVLKLVIGEAFEKEHWKTLFSMLKIPKEVSIENLTFGHLLSADRLLSEKEAEIKDLAARAQGEVTLREAINELRVWCDTTDFVLTEHNSNGRTTPLIKDWKDLMTKVSDNQALLGTLKESKFYDRFKDQIEQFEAKLGGIDDYLQKMNIIQRKWIYLEPIFSRGALPQEQPRFKRLDDEFRGIVLGIQRDPKVVGLCALPGIKDTLEMILDQLERCQKALNNFLEEKRQKFPRFYFLGDDDLLEILGQAKNPNIIQIHLKKLFAGIHTVQFSPSFDEIIAMKSSDGENVPLLNKIAVDDEIETWLGLLSKNMQGTLQRLLIGSLKEAQDLQKYPSQILNLAEEVNFYNGAVKAITHKKLPEFKNELQAKLESYTSNTNVSNRLIQLKLKALILDLIHQIEVVETLISSRVTDPGEWQWYKQLKFFVSNSNQICQIIMCKAQFDYTYEYQGNAAKLVHTPLTDKCYLTLTQGMSMGLGGNPYGPAGTGKTESVKALGQAFGRQVLVFNCDEGIDFKSMGRIFVGLVKCGAWGCFDEFNRLLEEQLSAISQQIQVIQFAIKESQPTVELLGKTVEVNQNAGIFVTMNPAGKAYGGRSKLPDNLKQLFRPVAMSVPDNELIAEVLLFAEGFKTAKVLAKKIVSVFNLSKQLLSAQQHYDWGLRALKTILTVGGQLIQEERKKGVKLDPNMEATLLIKAIRVNTMSKLTYSDSRKFVALLNDIFPGIAPEDIAYEVLTKAIKEVLVEMRLDDVESQIHKILQFYEATKQRMGIVLVGPSGSGKTTIWKVLKKAHEKMEMTVKTHVMNPKSMPRQQLLGHMDHDTREFIEGVLTYSARQVVKESSDVLNWIICDGDIDPEWIESLNSVLDDNHLLTLPTGERINFGNNVNFIFETHDLQYASPATVSRMGMIFLNYEDINIKSLITRWVKRQSESVQPKLEQFIDEYFYKGFEIAVQFEDLLSVTTTRVGLIMNALSGMGHVNSKGEFLEALIKGFASNFPPAARITVCEELAKELGVRPPVDPKTPLDFYYGKDNGQFRPYAHDLINQLKPADFLDTNEPPLVRTVGAQRDLDLIKSWVHNGDPFLLVGPEGCGKNLLMRNAFEELKKTMKIQIAVISCNAQTAASQIIQKLNQICLKAVFAQGRIYRPKEATRLVLYLKDINLPKPDKYQTIQMIAFLQQIITHRGFYDENLEFVYLDEKIQIVASMNPPGTLGRFPLSTRFTAIVRIAYVDYPTHAELSIIYTEYLKAVLQSEQIKLERSDPATIDSLAKRIAPFMVELFLNVKQKFSVDEHRHYLYTPSNLTAIVYGLLRYQIGSTDQLLEIISYEACRVFKDRIVNMESMSKFDNLLLGLLKQNLKFAFNPKDIFYSSVPRLKELKEGSKEVPYLTRLSKEDLKNIINSGLVLYEREYTELKIHFLDEVLELVAQLDRVLSRPGGAVLLAGRSGIAKRTCAYVVGTMLRLQIFTPLVTRDYTIREFKKDLRAAMENAAVAGKPTMLFVEDHHLTQKEFLEMLNSLLSSGEVPGLYRQEEIDSLLSNSADEIRRENYGKSLYDCFVSRVQTNLRIVLNFECTHPDFASNTASNPALFSRCNIIWLENWSKESYQAIAREELQSSLENNPSREDIQNYLIAIHRSVGTKASPRHYFSLIDTFKKIYGNKTKNRGNQTSHLMAGLRKLVEAQQEVDKLTIEAVEKKKELAIKQAEADQALKEITKSMQIAAERKQETETLSKGLAEESKIIQTHKVKIDEELREIQPMIDQAKEAVGSISRKDLDEVKSFKFPPEPVIDVFTILLKMLGQEDTSWSTIRKFLGPKSIESILNYEPRTINAQMRAEINREIGKRASSFEKQVIYRASLAAGPISEWIKATLKYSEILEKIQPLESEQNKLRKKLEVSEARLHDCQKQLIELDSRVIQLKDNFGQRTSEAEALKIQLKKAEDTLGVAQSLLGKLGEEKNRWENQVKQLEQQLKSLPYDSLLAAAFTIYLSDADEVIREDTMKEWKTLTKIGSFDYMKFISTESQILKWKSEGLPSDSLSLENSLMIFNTSKTPLLIDPNTAASEWLKRHYSSEKNLEIINQNDPKFATLLELAVRFGKIIIIQEIDYVDSVLFPLLRKDIMVQGPRSSIQLGEKTIDYNANFALYLTTRNPLIEIPPNANALVSVINYTVTVSGLEGQLLGIIINHEKPELEQKKTELLHNEEKLKVQLADLEKALLEELASSQGNILENKTLIESLNQTKSKSTIISESLKESTHLQESLDKQREAYRGLANKGSKLFIVINDLQKINNMYRFSLALYIRLFKKCLDFQTQSNKLEEKLDGCTNSLYRIVFDHIGTSLFKKDRLMFGLHIVKGMLPELFQANEWEFFLGHAVGNIEARAALPRWASEDRKDAFTTYASVFNRLATGLQFENESIWKPWYDTLECEKNLPTQAKGNISLFQRVLITQVFRPDRVESALNLFVCEALRIANISAQAFSLRNLYREESNNETPVLFVSSPGSDPSKELQEFAEAEIGRDNFQELSMGGGQNELAIQMLKEAAAKGLWLCYKNLHLVVSWLPFLEKELKGLNPHANFRLWLTTEPHLKFPPILLETCHKVTYEAPPGIKKNLQRTYQGWSPNMFEQGSVFKARMYFILSWFHAILQERRTYIPQGWSKFYEFSYGDLKAGTIIIDTLIDESKEGGEFKWDALYGLLESAIYGGRIDNELDLRVLRAYLEQYYNDHVLNQNKKVAGMIALPDSRSIKDYLMLISKLPESDNPSFFGLPVNIDRSVQRFNTNMVIEGMKRLQAGSTENLKFDREKWNEMLGPIIRLWKTLYKQVKDKGVPTIRDKQLNSDDPIESFIYTETNNCFVMLDKIDQSIENINGVLTGSGLLNSAIQSEALTLISGEIPSKWLTIWEGPANPNSWMKGFCKRAFSLKSWVHTLQQGNILGSQLNLSDLFHPEIFLNAVRQLTARKVGVPIDNMKLACSFEAGKLKSPVVLQMRDLLLQGCGFQANKLVDPPQNGPEFITLPTCYLAWLSATDVDPYMENTTALVPVYASGNREKMLTKLKIPNTGDPNDRIIGGVAICLADDE